MSLQQRGTILRWVFLMKRDAKLKKCIRGFRAAALMSLLSKWYAAVVVGLYAELEPIGKRCMVVPRGFSCEHMQARIFCRGIGSGRKTDVISGFWVVLQVSDSVCGQPGREDGVWRGQAFRGVKVFYIHGDSRTR